MQGAQAAPNLCSKRPTLLAPFNPYALRLRCASPSPRLISTDTAGLSHSEPDPRRALSSPARPGLTHSRRPRHAAAQSRCLHSVLVTSGAPVLPDWTPSLPGVFASRRMGWLPAVGSVFPETDPGAISLGDLKSLVARFLLIQEVVLSLDVTANVAFGGSGWNTPPLSAPETVVTWAAAPAAPPLLHGISSVCLFFFWKFLYGLPFVLGRQKVTSGRVGVA